MLWMTYSSMAFQQHVERIQSVLMVYTAIASIVIMIYIVIARTINYLIFLWASTYNYIHRDKGGEDLQ